VYQPPPEEFLPRNVEVKLTQEPKHSKNNGRKAIKILQFAGIFVAFVIASLAIIGSGYLDRYILSNSQVGIIAGVSLYNK